MGEKFLRICKEGNEFAALGIREYTTFLSALGTITKGEVLDVKNL